MAFTKDFDHVIDFTSVGAFALPIIEVRFWDGPAVPMLFDTGSSDVVLKHELCELIGASDWTEGRAHNRHTFGREEEAIAYAFDDIEVEILGADVSCTVSLMELPPSSLWSGVVGRSVFQTFGFGFYESEKRLYYRRLVAPMV